MWGTHGLLGGRWGAASTRYSPRPHQHFAVLVHGKTLGLYDLGRQILEDIIIQLKLPFEGTIGHAAAPLEHGQGVVQHLLEGHRRSPPPRWCVCQGRATFVQVKSL